MTERTKKYLYIGGGILAAGAIGLYLLRKLEAGSTASSSANSQTTQSELALLAAQMDQGGYLSGYGYSGGGGVAMPTMPAQPSIAEQLAQIEQAAGLTPATPASSTGAGGSTTPTAGSSSPASSGNGAPTTPAQPGVPSSLATWLQKNGQPLPDLTALTLEHEAFIS